MQSEEKRSRQNVDLASLEPSVRVKQLANYGAMVEVDPNVPPRRYYRSGLEMVRMANVYLAEGSLENAYILYMKFMTLFLEKIRKHPEYSQVPAQVKAVNQAKLKEVMPKAETLKKKLIENYTKEHLAYIEEQKNKHIENEKKRKQEHEDAKLAQRLQADEDNRTTTPHLRDTDKWESLPPSAPPMDGVLYPDDFASTPPRAPPHHYAPGPPLIPPSRPMQDLIPSPRHPMSGLRPVRVPGAVLSKFLHIAAANTKNKVETCGILAGILHTGANTSDVTTSPRYPMSGLRPVRVPAAVLRKFLHIAATNTSKKVETCGILACILERNELKITHVIVPQQSGSADSCSTNNEEDIFMYQDQHSLITLGWIHTHPTQTAFLSSVDLHTQCSYQLMMPEAIAIVCAPKYNETGYFALTPNHGMQFIANCRQTGFHPHPEDPPLFYDVTHIKVDPAATVEMVDLRR
ncbi:unnamed protein product [Plutella xylostella]|uniref:(diamondback moth) hypothetical protein n=1 Tax=Plutella xylostella TaxID=51655 RepID=A0A8S4G8T2_PLUXY|nr:unnamed protein product [Plutella xylostella]